MKKTLCILVVFLTGSFVFAQGYKPDKETENQVNEQVWKPFKKSWEERDAKAFNALHTDDVLRISKWSGIKVGSEYKDQITENYKRKDDTKRTIDFWLEHRIYSKTIGYEVGYLKIVSQRPGEDPRYSYSRFHVVLRKENGVWKIAQDWDTNNVNGNEVTAEEYAKGIPLDL
ncbi:MAG: nuclear transport factor 2 family protein [Cyclobacteriaceae bacterium]